MITVLATIGALSLTVTKVVDLVRNLPWFKGKAIGSYVWNVVALVVGLGFALGWQLDVTGAVTKLIPALQNTTLTGVAGQVLTGIVIGGAAGFWHELLDALSGVGTTLNRRG